MRFKCTCILISSVYEYILNTYPCMLLMHEGVYLFTIQNNRHMTHFKHSLHVPQSTFVLITHLHHPISDSYFWILYLPLKLKISRKNIRIIIPNTRFIYVTTLLPLYCHWRNKMRVFETCKGRRKQIHSKHKR